MNKRVLMILVSPGPGGAEKRFIQLFGYLSNNNDISFKITFIVQGTLVMQLPNICNIKNNEYANYKIFGFKYRPPKNTYFRFALRKIDQIYLLIYLIVRRILGEKYDVVHLINTSSLRCMNIVKSKRYVFSHFAWGDIGDKIIQSKNVKKYMKYIDKIDCLSSDIAYRVKNSGIVDSDKVCVSPCSFIDYNNLDEIETKKRIVSFSGTFTECKGVRLLVRAIIYLVDIYDDVCFWIIGRGEMEEFIRSELKDSIAKEKVRVIYVERPTELLKKSIIFLSLQEGENYPSQSLIEAMACENAIIATDVGLTKLLVNENTGIRIQYSVSELVSAIIIMLNDLEKTRKMGISASELVRKEHTVEKFWKYLKQIYINL